MRIPYNKELKEYARQKEIYAKSIGFYLLRFDDVEVIKNMQGVLKMIYDYIEKFENKELY